MAGNTDDAPPGAPAPSALTGAVSAAEGTATPTQAVAATPVRAASPILDRTSPPTTADAHAAVVEPPPVPAPPSRVSGVPTTTAASDSGVPNQPELAPPRNAPAEAQSTPTLPQEAEDPRIATLRGMFPDFDVIILQSVLDSVRGDQDRAIDVLLGMNDPAYVSQEQPHQSETDLDEELARRLALEEEDREARRLQQQEQATYDRANQHSWSPQAPAQGQAWGTQPQHTPGTQPPGEKDAITEITEQFGRFAETGKKTFSSLFAKVKAKVQEFETQQTAGFNKPQYGWDANQNQATVPPGQTLPPTAQQPKPQSTPQATSSYFDTPGPSGTTHQGNTPSFPNAIQSSGAPAGAAAARPQSPSQRPTTGAPTTATAQGFGAGFQAGDVTVPPANAPRESGFAALAAAADALGGRSSTDGHNAAAGRKSTDSQGALGRKSTDASAGLARSSSDVQTPRPPVTSTGPPTPSAIDPGRLGLLPKRPVSLLRESTTSIPGSGPIAPSGPAVANAAAATGQPTPARKYTAEDDDMYV